MGAEFTLPPKVFDSIWSEYNRLESGILSCDVLINIQLALWNWEQFVFVLFEAQRSQFCLSFAPTHQVPITMSFAGQLQLTLQNDGINRI